MNRRRFLTSTGSLLGLFGLGCQGTPAPEPPRKQAKKKVAKKPPAPPVFPFVPGSWTLVVLPDTQHYARSYPGLFRLQTEWIVANRERLAITYVLQTGDLTHTRTRREWSAASRALAILEGKVPYALVPGNHEYPVRERATRRTTHINRWFPPSRYADWPTFGGTREEGRIECNYHLFEAGGSRWIIVGLEWAPRDVAIQWARELLAKHPDRRAIVLTHAYLYQDSTRYDWARKGNSQRWNPHLDNMAFGSNDGEEIWQKLVRHAPNIDLVVGGHVLGDGQGFQVSHGDEGNRVNEMLVNYQMLEIGGGGWLRLLEFLPDRKTVQARTYSPLYERFLTDPENQFIFTID